MQMSIIPVLSYEYNTASLLTTNTIGQTWPKDHFLRVLAHTKTATNLLDVSSIDRAVTVTKDKTRLR